MSQSDRMNRPLFGTAERFKAEKKYGDVWLYSWDLVNKMLEAILVQGLGYGEDRVDDMSFYNKIKTLKAAKCLTDEQERILLHFGQKRVPISHYYTDTMMTAADDGPKDELADIAINALKAAEKAFETHVPPVRVFEGIKTYTLSFRAVEPNAYIEKEPRRDR